MTKPAADYFCGFPSRAQEESDVFGARLQSAVAKHEQGPSAAVDVAAATSSKQPESSITCLFLSTLPLLLL